MTRRALPSLCPFLLLPLVLALLPPAARAEEETAEKGDCLDLLDGDLDAWRGYRRDAVPSGWRLEDGVLSFDPDRGGRGDLITRKSFADFDLELEWRISEGGNSGIFFRVSEDEATAWASGPEMQVLDDERHVDGGDPRTSAGANYALHAPALDVVRPAGEWNRVRIVVEGARVRHWLNGELVVDYELWSEDWEEKVAASKFAALERYGRNSEGHLALQDHGDPVWYRNVRLCPIPEP